MSQDIKITLQLDDKGMVGRECPSPECNRYFKIKPGTGLATEVCYCPYCGTTGNSNDFITADQLEYARTMVYQKVVDPMLAKFAQNIKQMNQRQRGGLIRLQFSVRHSSIRLHRYMEKELETEVVCNNCGLEFAVYGVFASCPDCRQLNALRVCLTSLETAKKKIGLSQDEGFDKDLREEFLQDAVGGAVEAFDAYGKALRVHRTRIHANAKPNLFQDIEALNGELQSMQIPSIPSLIGEDGWEEMKWFFQARHVYAHNAGVVDERFVAKQPSYTHMIGRLLSLDADRIAKNVNTLGHLAEELDAWIT